MRRARAASIGGGAAFGRRRFLLRAMPFLLQAVAQLQASLQRLDVQRLRQQSNYSSTEMSAMVHEQQ